MIDEYVVDYKNILLSGQRHHLYLQHTLYVNTFSVKEYNERIASGRMFWRSAATHFDFHQRMRYRFMMQRHHLRLISSLVRARFRMRSVERLARRESGAFMTAVGAFATNKEELYPYLKGRCPHSCRDARVINLLLW